MAFCTSCGAQVNGAFCSSCGTPARSGQSAGAASVPPAGAQGPPPPVGVPVARKTSPIVWILVAVLAFFVVGGLATAGIMAFAVRKAARHAGISFRDGAVSIRARDGEGKDAVIELGGAAAKLPSWVPEYPGSKPVWSVHASGDAGNGEQGGNFTFTTSDSASKVLTFYQDKCKDLGMTVNLNTTSGEGGMIVATEEHGGDRSLTIVVGGGGHDTGVNVTYASK